MLRKLTLSKTIGNHVTNNDATAEENDSYINVASLTTDKNQEEIIRVYPTGDDSEGC